jgi:hypothetical protein
MKKFFLLNLKYQARTPAFLSSSWDSRFFLSFFSPFLGKKIKTFIQIQEFIFPFCVKISNNFQ